MSEEKNTEETQNLESQVTTTEEERTEEVVETTKTIIEKSETIKKEGSERYNCKGLGRHSG